MSWKQNGQSTIMGWIVLMAGSYAETYFLGEPSITLKSINFSYNGAATRTSSRLTFQSSRTRRFIYVSHPVSGITHTLTVQEIEQQTVPQNSFGSDRWIYPTHYIAMSYTLTPEPMENISVFDCDEGDRPIEVTPDDHSFRPVGSSSCLLLVLLVVQMVRQQLYMEQIHKKNFMLLVLLCTLNRLVMMSSGVSCSMLRSLTKKHSQLSKYP